MSSPVIICDLDGTLCSIKWRSGFVERPEGEKKDWKSFFAGIPFDRPNTEVLDYLKDWALRGGKIFYVSGRPSDYRKETVDWMAKHLIPHGTLLMRRSGDFRPDHEVKEEILDQYLKDKDIHLVLDDRQSVIDMWERRGLKVLKISDPGIAPFER